MFGRILVRSMVRHKGRVALAVVSVIVGVSIASALFSVSSGIGEKVALELRAYGPNILVMPKSEDIRVGIGGIEYGSVTEQRYINESDLSALSDLGTFEENGTIENLSARILGYAPYLYGVVRVGDQRAVLTGTRFENVLLVTPWWTVNGSWVSSENDAMVGVAAAEKLNLSVGDSFTVSYNNTRQTFSKELIVVGIVSTGSSEDDQIFVDLDTAQSFVGKPDAVSVVQISAHCIGCPIEVIAERIEEKMPYVEARSVKQIAAAEMMLLGKIEGLLVLIAVIGIAASIMGVTSAMTASVLERTKEIGIMKAVGASRIDVIALFGAEALIIGALGGLLGYGVGTVLASLIGQQVFGTAIPPNLMALPISGGVAMGVVLLASTLPIRRAVSVQPAIVLRGE